MFFTTTTNHTTFATTNHTTFATTNHTAFPTTNHTAFATTNHTVFATAALETSLNSDCSFFNFVMWGVVVMCLCQLGYIGNTLSFLALLKDKANAATRLLQSLSICDIVLLLSVNATDSIPYFCNYTRSCPNPWRTWPYVRNLWFFTPIAHMACIWMVVLIAANRYWAVCRPHCAAAAWSLRRTNLYIAVVVFASFALNSPRFFEYKVIDSPLHKNSSASVQLHSISPSSHHVSDVTNSTSQIFPNENSTFLMQKTLPQLNTSNTSFPHQPFSTFFSQNNNRQQATKKIEIKTKFGKCGIYKVAYKVIIVNFLLVLLPLSFLVLSSVWIIRVLKRSERRVQAAKTSPMLGAPCTEGAASNTSKRHSASKEVTTTLIAVILVAVTCQTPLAVFHYVRYLVHYQCGSVIFYLESASKLLVNANSCANFFIYYVISRRFRRLLASLVTCHKLKKPPSQHRINKEAKFNRCNHCMLWCAEAHDDGGVSSSCDKDVN